MSHEKLRPKFTIDSDKLTELKKLLPEAFADGKINWDTLKEALGEFTEDEDLDPEHFGLFWPGKREARRIAAMSSKGSLSPVAGEGKDEANTKNIFIEGENLEVLKLLQKSYEGRVKLIYIDPPYNTGNDFVYDDDFSEPLDEYLRRTGQVDEEGKSLTTNTRSDGRFHSKWLNMIYPRLKLARNLLADEGVMFISIDDNEVHNLIQILNEIFGEENYVHTLKWKRKKQPSFLHGHVASVMEYILVYAKEIGQLEKLSIEKRTDLNTRIDNAANKNSERLIKKGIRVKSDTTKIKKGVYENKTMSTEYLDDVIIKNGRTQNDIRVKAQFRNDQKEIDKFVDADVIFITKNLGLRRDLLQEELEKRKSITDLLLDWGDNQDSDSEMKVLFPEGKPFDYPKPSKLIANIIKSVHCEGEIIMDFFAGSGTTGHAVYEMNKEDNGNRKFILIQYPEEINPDSAFKNKKITTISDVTKERLKRSSVPSKNTKIDSDFGFKVYQLSKSNFRLWGNNDVTIESLENSISLFETPLVDNWKVKDLICEIMLLEGFPLDSNIELLKNIKSNELYLVTSNFCYYNLLICCDEKINSNTIRDLSIGPDDVLICLDSAINDQTKMRLSDICKLKTI